MAWEMRENSGSLFANKKHEQGDNKPNATGKALIGGVVYYVSAWTKTAQSGERFQSLAFKEADESAQAPTPETDMPLG